MNRYYLIIAFILITIFNSFGQNCSPTDASGCICKDSTTQLCNLLPDLTISLEAITDPGGYMEYPRTNAGVNYIGQGSDDGRVRLSIATPNIGYGHLEVRGTNLYICGTDTFTVPPFSCPNGKPVSTVIVQRIYQKDTNIMRYYDRSAGSMTYHPYHKHLHVSDWVVFSLRIKNPTEPDPLKWPLVGESSKMGYCLMDALTCADAKGYCKNNNDSILVNFPNARSETYKTCGESVQGISSGYIDVYTVETYGMWIDLPPGTCNGNYYLVAAVDPFNHILEEDESNNMIVMPLTLYKQDTVVQPIVKIHTDKPLTLCKGDKITLTAPGAVSYQWSTGDTTQSISVSKPGKYSVSITSLCGSAASDSLIVTAVDPPAVPIFKTDTICKGNFAKLSSLNKDTLNWYESAVSNEIIYTGTDFYTPVLNTSTTYYAENVDLIHQRVYHAGKPDTTGKGEYLAGENTLNFECLAAFTIDSVTVYSALQQTDSVPISLKDQYGTDVYRKWFRFNKGKNTISLKYKINPGNYQLHIPNWRDTLFCNVGDYYYPMDIPGVISIKNSSQGRDKYFYFYNWVITTSGANCRSARVPITTFVDASCITGQHTMEQINYKVSVHPNPFTDVATLVINDAPAIEKYSLHLSDLTGREISVMFSGENKFQIQRSMMETGFYIYRIYLKDKLIAIGKLVAE